MYVLAARCCRGASLLTVAGTTLLHSPLGRLERRDKSKEDLGSLTPSGAVYSEAALTGDLRFHYESVHPWDANR
jgi:hypothetical protein